MSDTVIKAEHLSKWYRLGVINNGTLFRDIQTWWALKHGKQDPHSSIDAHKYDSGMDGFWALSDLNFEIKQGDRVGIIGKNGAGKSTLLKVLSRITAPTEGVAKIKGRVSSLLEVGTGFHPELTGRENIYLNGAILGLKRREVAQKIDEIIAFSEIEEHIDTPVKRYSSGMYVKLAFAVAAHLDSEILIADEVLAVGDAAFQKKALGKMNDLSTGQGRTVLFVSHNMSQIKNLCTRGIVLNKGSLIRQDDNIKDSIAYYLGTDKFGDDLATTSWHNDGVCKDRFFCPQKMYITDMKDKLVKSELSFNSDYKLVLEVDVNEENSFLDYFANILMGTETICVLPMNQKKKLTVGSHKIEWILPKEFFPAGLFTVTIGSVIQKIRWNVKPEDMNVSLVFTVKNKSIIKEPKIKMF